MGWPACHPRQDQLIPKYLGIPLSDLDADLKQCLELDDFQRSGIDLAPLFRWTDNEGPNNPRDRQLLEQPSENAKLAVLRNSLKP